MTGSFLTNPKLEFLYPYMWGASRGIPREFFDGKHAVLLEDFSYATALGYRTAREGLVTDGGSIPRCFWFEICAPFMEYLPAFLIHDQDCEDAHKLPPAECERALDEADERLLETLGVLHCPWLKKRLIYRAVCLAHEVRE
jgi:hypothetical protein